MNIRVDLNTPIKDGTEVVFRSPVDCSQVTGLIVYYQENGNTASKEFAFADAHGNDVGNIDHLFAENAVVKVILDIDANMAFVQNADTNAYIEGRFKNLENDLQCCAGAIECNSKGEVITLKDSSNRLVRGMKIYGKTTQNGTPTQYAPVELESVGESGSIGVTVLGKNRANCPEELTFTTSTNLTIDPPLDPGTYTVSALVTSSDTDVDYNFVCFVGGRDDGENVYATLQRNTRNSSTVTIANQVSSIQLRAASSFSYCEGDTSTYKQLQIEKGDTATEYEPYKAPQTLTAQTPNGLPGIPVESGGNYTDESGQQWICDYKDYSRGVYVQRINAKTFTGNETISNFSTIGTESSAFYYSLTGNEKPMYRGKLTTESMCTHYTNATITTSSTLVGHEIRFTSNLSSTRILFRPENVANLTLDDFTELLKNRYEAGTPVVVIYPLETPIETPLSAEELAQYAALHTNKPNTTVFNDANAYMELAYNADTKTYIDNKFAELAAAIVNNA